MRHRFPVIALSLALIGSLFSSFAIADEAGDAFEKHIRPLLLEKCIECHGPAKQEHLVRLDRRADVLNGKAGDVAFIVPGNPDTSRLWQVIQHHDNDIAMPPSGKLPPEQLEYVRQWIVSGAVWPETSDLEGEAKRRAEKWREHWSFQPVHKPDLSQVPANVQPIDFFIRRALSEKGLKPSPPATPHVLVRRLSYAITGLPPELADLKAATDAAAAGQFDQWKSAYIDRLLNAPQYGERWARLWMDVSRYADTKGYVFTEDREYHEAWRNREWVIRSLNQDMPYDEFVKRQLAADQMPGSDDPSQLAAMGFLTLGRRFLNNPHDIIDDRIDVVSRGLLGLTVSCSRCHDHKYDPLTQSEYYRLFAFINNSSEACMTIYTPKELAARKDVLARVADIENGIKQANPGWAAQLSAWESSAKAAPRPEWKTLDLTFDDTSSGGQKFLPQGDGSYLAAGYAPTHFGPKSTAPSPLTTFITRISPSL